MHERAEATFLTRALHLHPCHEEGFEQVPGVGRRAFQTTSAPLVEYTAFPRSRSDHSPRIAIVRDLSSLGLCLTSTRAEAVGSLQRLLHPWAEEGFPAQPTLARVIWCRPDPNGGFSVGLNFILNSRPAFARALSRLPSQVAAA